MDKSNGNTILESKITAVTVYSDRASVSRNAKISLPKGEHKLLFDSLPDSIEQNSIQVSGKGEAILGDIKFKEAHYAQIPDKKVKAMHDEKQKLQDRLRTIDDKIAQAGKEKTFIDNIALKLTQKAQKEDTTSELDPAKWKEMVSFYRSKIENIDKEIHEAEKSKRDINNEIKKLTKEIQKLGSDPAMVRDQIEVSVEMQKEGDLILDLSYIVYGPSWYPVYDLRVLTDSKMMNVSYNAHVVQGTEEDWDEVAVSLSTAKPQIGGQQPELSPWYIDIYVTRAAASRPVRRIQEKTKSAPMSQMYKDEPEMDKVLADEAYDDMPEMTAPEATVDTKATSVVFVVSGKNTIKSDNQEHKVTIMRNEFEADFRYSTVPKLSQYAYLKAKVKNKTQFPLLPGESNVFLDNNFVANSYMNLVSPDEEFWTFLGVDEGMKVEHKFLKKYQKTEGVISRKNVTIYEYLIEITNNKKTAEELVVWDQIPISNHEDIEVELINPKFKENTDKLKKNEYNYLEWFFKPAPGDKIKIPLKFSVEYPRDKSLSGLI